MRAGQHQGVQAAPELVQVLQQRQQPLPLRLPHHVVEATDVQECHCDAAVGADEALPPHEVVRDAARHGQRQQLLRPHRLQLQALALDEVAPRVPFVLPCRHCTEHDGSPAAQHGAPDACSSREDGQGDASEAVRDDKTSAVQGQQHGDETQQGTPPRDCRGTHEHYEDERQGHAASPWGSPRGGKRLRREPL